MFEIKVKFDCLAHGTLCHVKAFCVFSILKFIIIISFYIQNLVNMSRKCVYNLHNMCMIQLVLLLCSLCKYMMLASGRASVFILRTRAQKLIKVLKRALVE